MFLTILGIIFLTALLTFVLVKNSNPNRRYWSYREYNYDEDDGEDEEDEGNEYDELAEDISPALTAMGFKKREINRALDACPPDPYLPVEDNIKETLQYLGKHGRIPR